MFDGDAGRDGFRDKVRAVEQHDTAILVARRGAESPHERILAAHDAFHRGCGHVVVAADDVRARPD